MDIVVISPKISHGRIKNELRTLTFRDIVTDLVHSTTIVLTIERLRGIGMELFLNSNPISLEVPFVNLLVMFWSINFCIERND